MGLMQTNKTFNTLLRHNRQYKFLQQTLHYNFLQHYKASLL